MTWKEWLIGWIYYLPDFGDSLARALFAQDDYVRLGWGEQGFYDFGRRFLQDQAHAKTHPDPAVGYLLHTYAFSQPVKHLGVSALLLWRGLFVPAYGSLAALVLAPWVMRAATVRQRRIMAYMALPALAIAGVHAAISVSIPRYNLALIPVYGTILTLALTRIILLVQQRQSPRLGKGQP